MTEWQTLNRDYVTIVIPEITDRGQLIYVASHPDLPGCMSHGSTKEDALNGLKEATALYLDSFREKGIPLPEAVTASGPGRAYDAIIWEVTALWAEPQDAAVVESEYPSYAATFLTDANESVPAA